MCRFPTPNPSPSLAVTIKESSQNRGRFTVPICKNYFPLSALGCQGVTSSLGEVAVACFPGSDVAVAIT